MPCILQESLKLQAIFIRHTSVVCGKPPMRAKNVAVIKTQCYVGITDINCKEHDLSIHVNKETCKRVRGYLCTCLLIYLLNDVGDHIELVELRHDVDASCPSLELLDQLNSQLHADSDSALSITGCLDTLPCLLRDEDAGHFIMKEVRMSHIDQRQDARQDRLIELSIFCFIAFKQSGSVFRPIDWLCDEKIRASLDLTMQILDFPFDIRWT